MNKKNCNIIIYIEDTMAHARLVLRSLKSIEFPGKIIHIKNSQEALAYINNKNNFTTKKPSLFLIDLKLAQINGLEILAKIKNKNYLKHIPAIIFSTSMLLPEQKKALKLGAAAFHVKPEGFSEYCSILKHIIKAHING
ncbi:MAG TPA: response regulator [Spirochaetota bacterium]|nr:response regulator [Spirochaetota bacterium]